MVSDHIILLCALVFVEIRVLFSVINVVKMLWSKVLADRKTQKSAALDCIARNVISGEICVLTLCSRSPC